MQLKEIMKRDVVTIAPEATVIEAAQKMGEYGVGCLLVSKGDTAKGILTDRDIVLKVIAREMDPSEVKVTDVMQSHIIWATPETDVLEATRLMSANRIRRLPIQEDGRVVGIVSITDLGHIVREEVDHLFSFGALVAHR